MPLVPRSRIEIKNEIYRSPSSPNDIKRELQKLPHFQVKKAYRIALNEAAKELNVKLPSNPHLDTNLSERKLIESLIKVILTYEIDPKEFIDKTLNVLGSILFHLSFPKVIH